MRSFRNDILNPFLRGFGYEITKVSKFRAALERAYKSADDFVFVQIGANDGVSFDDLYEFVTTHTCRGLVVEPLKDMFEQLKVNYKNFQQLFRLTKRFILSRNQSLFIVSRQIRPASCPIGRRALRQSIPCIIVTRLSPRNT